MFIFFLISLNLYLDIITVFIKLCFKDMFRDIKNDMWYLGFTLRESKDKLIHFIR